MKLEKAILVLCTAVVWLVAITLPTHLEMWFGVGCLTYATWTYKD